MIALLDGPTLMGAIIGLAVAIAFFIGILNRRRGEPARYICGCSKETIND